MKKALIVDDIPENLYLLESLLKAYGYIIVLANNGAEALGLALKDPPDIIISDILMPVMDGYTLCREWRKDDVLKEIPFVFYTATYTHPKDEEFALTLGADKFIVKPQEPEVFIAIIEKVLLEFRNGKILTTHQDESSEIQLLKEYNETLIRKMEDRMLKSEEAEKKIRVYAAQLEAEIEQRKQASQALKESEDKYRSIFENSGVAILLTAPDGRIFSANSFACKLFGYTEKEICTLGRNGLVDSIDVNLEILLKERKQFGLASGELTFIRNDGSKFPAEVSSTNFHDKDGNERTSTVIRDLTEQKIAEDALKKSELRFRLLAESSPVGIFTTDGNGLTTYVNPRWCDIAHLSFDEALGNGWLKATHPDDRENLALSWQQTSISGQATNAEYRFVHPDGSEVWVIGQAVPQKNDQNITTGYIGTITDITERKKMEADLIYSKEKAEESDRLKTAFLTNMSHEIRTPMNGILGFLELLNSKNLDDTSRQQYINVVNLSGQRLLDTINDIIEISKIEAGEQDVRNSGVDIAEVMQNHVEFFQLQANKKGIAISIAQQILASESFIETDKYKLESILTNLVKNAVKFTSRGIIQLGNYIENETLVFYVKDTGCGIPANRFKAIFERFVQAETGLARSYEGSGLGLSIAKAFVSLMGGDIWVESEVDKGSTFYFSIPYKPKPVKNNLIEDKNKQNERFRNETSILVAEDDDTSYQYLEVILKQKNIVLIRAKSGYEAIQRFKQNPGISLILMDIKMPVMDGFEATREIRKLNNTIPVIAQTAFALSGNEEKAIQAGCNGYITKPIKLTALDSMLNKYLR
ncbi:MAG: response regulator [Draconibacterium sp.]